jgi:Zn-dependent peptidase ImmA (M78 family)/transcriptional regulator with XRE-family HTH domain
VSVRAAVALFDSQRLRLAREFRGLRRSDLAQRIGISPSAITQLENGSTKPASSNLNEIALSLGFPIDFFLEDGRRQKVQDHRAAFFRSLRSTRQMDRDRAAARAFLVVELFDALQRYVRLPEINLPEGLYVDGNADRNAIEQRALALRKYWGIAPGPIPNAVRLLEVNGVIVTYCAFEAKELSSFSRWFGRRPVVVLKDERDDMVRLRFDAIHELGHLVLHEEAEPGNQILESQANSFAASFLTPKEQIIDSLPRSFDIERFHELKETWGVSIAALLYRSRELGRMTESTYRRAMMTIAKNRWRINEPFPIRGHESADLLRRGLEVLRSSGKSDADLIREARLPADFLSDVSPQNVLPILSL